MFIKTVVGLSVSAACLCFAPSGLAATNLVTNGSMNISGQTGSSWVNVADGWTANNTQGYNYYHMGGSSDGGLVTGINGSGGYYQSLGGVHQTISSLEVGHVYQLSFEQAVTHAGYPNGGYSANWGVTFGGETKSSSTITTVDNPNGSTPYWTKQTMTFTATSISQVLTFAGYINGDPTFLGLDGVSLIDVTAVPEPSSYALMLAGMGALGFLVRRRRQQG